MQAEPTAFESNVKTEKRIGQLAGASCSVVCDLRSR